MILKLRSYLSQSTCMAGMTPGENSLPETPARIHFPATLPKAHVNKESGMIDAAYNTKYILSPTFFKVWRQIILLPFKIK